MRHVYTLYLCTVHTVQHDQLISVVTRSEKNSYVYAFLVLTAIRPGLGPKLGDQVAPTVLSPQRYPLPQGPPLRSR